MSRRTILATTAATTAITVGLVLTGCSAAGTVGAPATTSPGLTATPTTPGLNTPVTVGTFEYTALAVKDAGTTVGSSVLTRTAQGTYLQVDLKIANTGSSAATFIVNDVKLIDASGKAYDADPTATLYASPDQNAWVAALNPGNSIQGPVLFDVPAGTTPASIRVSDNAFTPGKTIALG